MDLIGKIYSTSAAGNLYTLTVICMLMGYTFCIPYNSNQVVKLYSHMLVTYMLNLVVQLTFCQTMTLSL